VERIFVEGKAVILYFDKNYTSQVWVSVIVVSNLGLITTIAFFFCLEVFLKFFLFIGFLDKCESPILICLCVIF
jgi:hypothetical protein